MSLGSEVAQDENFPFLPGFAGCTQDEENFNEAGLHFYANRPRFSQKV